MRAIKLMPDYQCWPLWYYHDPNHVGNLDPHDLNLDDELLTRLAHWAQQYTDTLNWDAPNEMKDLPIGFWDAFEVEGIALWQLLQIHLKNRYRVVYYSTMDATLHE